MLGVAHHGRHRGPCSHSVSSKTRRTKHETMLMRMRRATNHQAQGEGAIPLYTHTDTEEISSSADISLVRFLPATSVKILMLNYVVIDAERPPGESITCHCFSEAYLCSYTIEGGKNIRALFLFVFMGGGSIQNVVGQSRGRPGGFWWLVQWSLHHGLIPDLSAKNLDETKINT
jgi:hypothetical protein